MEIDALYTVPLRDGAADGRADADARSVGIDDQGAGAGGGAVFAGVTGARRAPQNAIQANRNSVLLSPALRPNPS